MFPKLSQKAWSEIRSLGYYANTTDERKLGVEAFMSLFDLEKYPITKDMICAYIKSDGQRRLLLDFLANILWAFDNGGIKDCLTTIGFYGRKDRIIIIGEIHGWWEKGETQ